MRAHILAAIAPVAAPLVAAATIAATASAQSPAASSAAWNAVWPERVAVGARLGESMPPVTVEADKTGWVTITFLSQQGVVGRDPAPIRMLTGARDLEAWIARTRPIVQAVDTLGGDFPLHVVLGHGGFQVEARPSGPTRGSVNLYWRHCQPGYGSAVVTKKAALDFLDLLDSAARVAGGRDGRAPTLARPYFSEDVSCPARPDTTNARVEIDSARFTGPVEIGTAFVVDTAGNIERGSIEFLPGADTSVVRAARSAMQSWHFHAAEIDGTPVRQVVERSLIAWPRRTLPFGQGRLDIHATHDGWVYYHSIGGPRRGDVQDWFHPDSIDAYAQRLDALNLEAAAISPDSSYRQTRMTSLGWNSGVRLSAGYLRQEKRTFEVSSLAWCGDPHPESSGKAQATPIFRNAAREARADRSPPADPGRGNYTGADVACPASLPWVAVPVGGLNPVNSPNNMNGVWRPPVGVYPDFMRSRNARADVLASFLVDSIGVADPRTVVVLASTDRRLAAAVRASLAASRYQPATRAGRRVSQRVIDVIRFEPPPICAALDANPACPHRYRDR